MKKLNFYKAKFEEYEYKKYFLGDITVCSKAYAKLYLLESFLQHNIENAFIKTFGNDWQLFQSIYQKDKVTMGFWVKLFSGKFHDSLYISGRVDIKQIFPGFKKYDLSLKKIFHDLDGIRKFRNNIFHFDYNMELLHKSLDFQESIKIIDKYIYGLSCDGLFGRNPYILATDHKEFETE